MNELGPIPSGCSCSIRNAATSSLSRCFIERALSSAPRDSIVLSAIGTNATARTDPEHANPGFANGVSPERGAEEHERAACAEEERGSSRHGEEGGGEGGDRRQLRKQGGGAREDERERRHHAQIQQDAEFVLMVEAPVSLEEPQLRQRSRGLPVREPEGQDEPVDDTDLEAVRVPRIHREEVIEEQAQRLALDGR
jgi:hypothetical protein